MLITDPVIHVTMPFALSLDSIVFILLCVAWVFCKHRGRKEERDENTINL
jgi:hypothetical protein